MIHPLSRSLEAHIRHKIDTKTKPPGSLGQLEEVALQIALICQTPSPQLHLPHLLVFAADHGIAEEGVSGFPQEITRQMVLNFLRGGAAINVFCRQNGMNLHVIDAGVKGEFSAADKQLIHRKVAQGTRNFAHHPAMTPQQCHQALGHGAEAADEVFRAGSNLIGFGEMGIGNTASAAVLMHKFTGLPLPDCTGRGTGLTDAQLAHKTAVLEKAVAFHAGVHEPVEVLTTFGGFEIVQMCGAMLRSAERGMVLLIDGFIATAALLAAHRMEPDILDYCIFCHQSDEHGHRRALEFLRARPLLNLHMRLGEGTGCALAYPLIQSAVAFLNEMADFNQLAASDQQS